MRARKDLESLLSGALVEYRCAKGHAHTQTIPDAHVSIVGIQGLEFDDVTCPFCEAERTGWIPPSHIRRILWEP